MVLEMYFCSLLAALSLASYWYFLIPQSRQSLLADRCVFFTGEDDLLPGKFKSSGW